MKYHKISSAYRLIGACLFGITLLSCESDDQVPELNNFEIKSLGLSGVRVNELRLMGNDLYAITQDGIYKSNITSSGTMELVGLKGKNILTAALLSDTEFLASFRDINDMDIAPLLYHSTDGGATWKELENDFGGEVEEPLFHFEWNPSQPSVLYGTGYQVIAKSTDKGVSWEPIWGDFDMFANRMKVFVNPAQPTDIWAGGQGGMENGYLIHLSDEEEINYWNDLVPNPTTVKKVAFDTQTPQGIYVGWEGELARTTDDGQTWETLIDRHEEAHFFFGVGFSSTNPNLVFAGKWEKTDGPQPLELFYSLDKGDTWEVKSFPGVTYGGIHDLIVKTESGKERVFVGLDKGGVYEIVMNR
ncbi:WD40/YVTN/BNR-like repeat-containing protein [Pleomorphovibrio marinus]|uniref:WD40/YVTN/BNR-like repeat-containing protein n=1 Tax=Pleomorphovibrio marinus TaxID=2164132 RepID=UPI000E0B2FBD|nr:hypothetical protein [Pleomorphovibrio marinus]